MAPAATVTSSEGAPDPPDFDDRESPVLQINNEDDLPEAFLHVLGEDPRQNTPAPFDLHEALNSRWSHVIANGLVSSERDSLFKSYQLPSNCVALTPPILNPEISSILSGPNLKRDNAYLQMQTQLSHGSSALASAVHLILENKEIISQDLTARLLAGLRDASRIHLDLLHQMSLRRTLIYPSLSKSVKVIVEKSTPLQFLFGNELGEQIKAAKLVAKAGKDLKAPPVSHTSTVSSRRTLPKFARGEKGGESANLSRPYNSGPLNRNRPARSTGRAQPQKGQPSKTRYHYQRRQ
ncbi:hypothetical protein PPYR_10765 [Photinus pyralis]|uniref:Uncharacterized protein n=1 Tax=Photinus pyralis TaxID=7054 RepID=A0A5N4AHB8_PHOPY|nr:hypothetical protein PPYR_10765 [Photinus pyralis]